ncbi:MAG: MaoC family dehydratase [Deltaproteobacteria bacterium]|nr:MAG: MaoC family dehydratase [Deltaproteobacteria bacterium]
MAALDLTVGQTATRSLTFTQRHVDLYAEISGDRNPLHFDPEFVAATPFGRPVVHGGLTSGILNALVAEDMPGPGTVFMSMDLKFTAPVFIGDTITATAEVLEVHERKPVCQLAVRIVRSDGTEVLTGTTWCYRFMPG